MAKTKIEWCDYTFNPWIGCQKVSPACDNCYADRLCQRFGKDCFGTGKDRIRTGDKNWEKMVSLNRRIANRIYSHTADGFIKNDGLHERKLNAMYPKVFCGSMCDVFDNAVPDTWRKDLFRLIAETSCLDWLILTKRIGNAPAMIERAIGKYDSEFYGLQNNVWLGITVCNQQEAERDIPKLLDIPAKKHFLSMEPLLGRFNLEKARAWQSDVVGVDWVIVGGESGPNARPMHPDWVRRVRDDCELFATPFFFKQWGEWLPAKRDKYGNVEFCDQNTVPHNGFLKCRVTDLDATFTAFRFGKKASGRLLDGKTWDGVPE